MGKWVKERLGAKSTISRGGSPRPIEDYVSPEFEGYNWIKIGDVKPGAKYIESTAEKMIPAGLTKTREVHAGDFLLSNSMSFGRPYISKIDGCIHDGWLAIQSYNETFDTNFLYYCLGAESTIAQYRSLAAGSTVLNLKKEMVAKVNVTYPVSLDEQRHIAEILTTCDEVIEKSEAVVEKYRAIKAGMLNDLFTRGIGKNGKLRPPPESSPQLYKDTALGKVPREWEVVPVGKLFAVQLGKMLDAAKNVGVKKPYLGNRAVQWGRIDVADIETVRLTDDDLSRFRLRKGDLLVCEGGEVGRAAIWQDELPECYYQKALHRVRLKEGMCYSIPFLFYQLQLFADRKLFDTFVTQTSIAHLTKEKLESVPILDVELNEQQRIAERLSAIDAKIADELAVIAKYRKVKTGLMARLLTPPDGEVE